MAELSSTKLDAGYDGRAIVREVEIAVAAGKIVTLVGPNGAGKSTLLKTFAGALPPVNGKVFIDAKDMNALSAPDRAKKLAVMTTARSSIDYATCREVVAVGRYRFTGIFGTPTARDNAAVDDALNAVGAHDLRDREFAKLSDGQKQRVLLARALAQEPGVMILDEPTSFLDVGYKLLFVDALKTLARQKHIGVLMSLHELELARNVSDLVVCVAADGRVDKVGTPDEVFTCDYIETLFNIPRGELGKIYGFLAEKTAPTPKHVHNASVATKKTKFLMVQGTMSGVGKSLLTAGICRVFMQDGYRVAPFKSQNMALNSFVTKDGLEMGRAQVMQAEAAGIEPDVAMNPILLKPTDDVGSQVIVNGKVVGNMRAREYFQYKKTLVPEIVAAVERLSAKADIIVIEGAGSPAEINLKQNDIVNMGMAQLVDAPVLLAADIDRGGVFAQLLGTLELLEPDERARVKGLIVNKFRGDKSLLDSGIAELERRGGVPVVGVVPYAKLELDDEDSLAERLDRRSTTGEIRVGVVRFPHIANFTDFNALEQYPCVALTYVTRPEELERLDLLVLPGAKNTIADMRWLKTTGLEPAIKKCAANDMPILGICGGYQMLGESIDDPDAVEAGGSVDGLGLLPVRTRLTTEKRLAQTRGEIVGATGALQSLVGAKYEGYEIHMGETTPTQDAQCVEFTSNASGYARNNVYGTYVHGVFDAKSVSAALVEALAKRKGVEIELEDALDYDAFRMREYDKLADVVRANIDMETLYKIVGIER